MTSQVDKENEQPKHPRLLRWCLLIIGLGLGLLQIAITERRVAQLRADGFSEIVIDSTRNHTYFPMVGAFIGALLFIGIVKLIKHFVRRKEDG